MKERISKLFKDKPKGAVMVIGFVAVVVVLMIADLLLASGGS
jgi:hypothetical protein